MQMFLKSEDLWKYIDDTLTLGSQNFDKKRNQKTMVKMCLMTSLNLYVHISSAKRAKEAWDKWVQWVTLVSEKNVFNPL